MSESRLSGEEIIRQNMEAFESGQDLPHSEEEVTDQYNHSEVDDSQELIDEIAEEEASGHQEEDGSAQHMSKEDWIASGKDPDEYLTPDEFKRAGDLRNKSNLSLAKKLAQQESMMQEILANQNRSIEEATTREREKVLLELKKQQAEAVEFSETEKALELERKIAEHEMPEPPKDEPRVDPAITEWHSKNSDWYNVDPSATGLLNVELQRAQRKNLPFSDAIGPAMDKVKRHFPYLFDDGDLEVEPKSKAVPPRPRMVTEKSRAPSKAAAKKRSFSELDPSIQAFARKAAKAAGLTEQQYMEQM